VSCVSSDESIVKLSGGKSFEFTSQTFATEQRLNIQGVLSGTATVACTASNALAYSDCVKSVMQVRVASAALASVVVKCKSNCLVDGSMSLPPPLACYKESTLFRAEGEFCVELGAAPSANVNVTCSIPYTTEDDKFSTYGERRVEGATLSTSPVSFRRDDSNRRM
jgi:hypothetical protein